MIFNQALGAGEPDAAHGHDHGGSRPVVRSVQTKRKGNLVLKLKNVVRISGEDRQGRDLGTRDSETKESSTNKNKKLNFW
jgi:hypothetical protein